MPPSYQTGFEGVDGTKIPKEEWFNPSPSLLPAPLSEESKERTRETIQKNPDIFERRREELMAAWRGETRELLP
jgi:hypothetical protein